jgi:hypothetical protein
MQPLTSGRVSNWALLGVPAAPGAAAVASRSAVFVLGSAQHPLMWALLRAAQHPLLLVVRALAWRVR